ncbi:MAG: alpha-ketoglutarate-dependent dioxygenase AlkB [Melioribacteraceae bacterium]
MEQLDLFNTKKNEPELIKIQDGEYIYLPNFFNKQKSDRLFKALFENIDWKQEEMNMYGRVVKFPRLTAWYGDNNKPYSFSGIKLNPTTWNDELLEIKKAIEPKCEAIFNSVLLNQYRDGSDSISWHTDAEKELGINPIIASVNFGATRKFQLRHKETKEKIEIELKHGSLLIMKGALQHFWQHQVPKTKKKVGNRINLTFRIIK